MSARDENEVLRRGIRVDLVIAVCALLVSTLATGATWWQSRVVAEQLSSQVWPYISISTTYDPAFVAIDVTNDGLGPAIIRSVVLRVDGKVYTDPTKALGAIATRHGKHRIGAQLSDISPGSVIRASGSVRLAKIQSSWIATDFARSEKRVDLSVCYCSLLDRCWLISLRQTGDPKPMKQCPDPGADQLRVPAVLSS